MAIDFRYSQRVFHILEDSDFDHRRVKAATRFDVLGQIKRMHGFARVADIHLGDKVSSALVIFDLVYPDVDISGTEFGSDEDSQPGIKLWLMHKMWQCDCEPQVEYTPDIWADEYERLVMMLHELPREIKRRNAASSPEFMTLVDCYIRDQDNPLAPPGWRDALDWQLDALALTPAFIDSIIYAE